MQKKYLIAAFITISTFFFGIFLLVSENVKSIFLISLVLMGFFILYTLWLISTIFLKNSSPTTRIFTSLYSFFSVVILGSLVIRFIFSLYKFSSLRHYMDTCFDVFFAGIIGVISMLLITVVHIIFFKKEKDFI